MDYLIQSMQRFLRICILVCWTDYVMMFWVYHCIILWCVKKSHPPVDPHSLSSHRIASVCCILAKRTDDLCDSLGGLLHHVQSFMSSDVLEIYAASVLRLTELGSCWCNNPEYWLGQLESSTPGNLNQTCNYQISFNFGKNILFWYINANKEKGNCYLQSNIDGII